MKNENIIISMYTWLGTVMAAWYLIVHVGVLASIIADDMTMHHDQESSG